MRSLILILGLLVTFHMGSQACTCNPFISNRSFCQTFREEADKLTVIRGKVLNQYHWGAYVEVIDNIYSTANKDTVVVWGDNGLLCRYGAGIDGDTVILSMLRTDMGGNAGPDEDYENPEDYMISACGTYTLSYHNGKVIGNYTGSADAIDYSTFLAELENCVFTNKINESDNLSISMNPNPVNDKVFVKSFETISQISVYDLTGKKLITENIGQTACEIDLKKYGLVSGIYMSIVNLGNGKRIVKKIVYIGL